jgi:L-amino acid N-acyltransferase YncA
VATSLKARLAELRDAPAIAEIYNQGIEDRTATFETEPRTGEAVGELLRSRMSRYPAVVVEDGNRVLGFAWTSEYRPRSAYAGVAEFTIYVARSARGQGVGRLALKALMTEAERRGFWKLVSRIFLENVASRRLCAALGLRPRSNVSNARMARSAPLASGDARVIVERLLGSAARD